MTITGAQSNPMTGGPQPWEPGSVNTNAAQEAIKAGLGITSDTLQRSFTEVGTHTKWKYDTPTSNPSLSAPLRQLRIGEDPGQPPSREWNTFYKQLVDSLPEEVKGELLQEQDELYTNRHPRYEALDRLLELTAKGMQQLHQVDRPIAPESAEALHQLFNYALPGIALNGSLKISQEVVQRSEGVLSTLNSQSTGYDQKLTDLEGLQTGHQQLALIAEQLISPQEGTDPRAIVRSLANDQGALHGGLHLAGEEGTMMILQTTLSAIRMVSLSATLETGSPPLFIGLTAATKEATAPIEEGGFIGTGLQQLIDGFSTALSRLYGQANRPGGEAILNPLLIAISSLLLGTAGVVAEQGIAPLPTETALEKQQEQRFSAQLLLHLLIGSDTLDQLARKIMYTGEIPGQGEVAAAKGLTLATLLMIAYAAAQSDGHAREELLAVLQPKLLTLFETISQDYEGKRLTDTSDPLSLFLQQGLMAVQEGNFAALVAAMDQGLTTSGISPQQLRKDLTLLSSIATEIQHSVTEGLDDKSDTGTAIQFVSA